jgi:CRISPR-associated protein Cas2
MTATRWLVCYDIADPRRLRRVERRVAAIGVYLHDSLYACELDDAELAALQADLARLIDLAADSVRYLPWCDADRAAAQHLGDAPAPRDAAAWIV